eukprot:607531-Hanusia_phi.AAC.2
MDDMLQKQREEERMVGEGGCSNHISRGQNSLRAFLSYSWWRSWVPGRSNSQRACQTLTIVAASRCCCRTSRADSAADVACRAAAEEETWSAPQKRRLTYWEISRPQCSRRTGGREACLSD